MNDPKNHPVPLSLISRRQMLRYGLVGMAGVVGGFWPVPAFGNTGLAYSARLGSTEWKTWCVGRNLIDLPAGSKVEYETKIESGKITRLRDIHTTQQLQKLVNKRVEELRKQPHRKEAGSMYVGLHNIPGGGMAIRR